MKIILFCLVLLVTVVFCRNQGGPCVWTDPTTGYNYDFSPLRNNQQDYYLPKNGVQKWDIWLNMCRPLVGQICAAGTAGCQQWDPSKGVGGRASMGAFAGMTFVSGSDDNSSVVAQFINGDGNRHFQISFVCDQNQTIGSPQYLGENPPLQFNFQWYTAAACESCGDSNCGSCLNGTGCKWCLDAAMCIPVANKVCGGFITNPKFCPQPTVCSRETICQNCTTDIGCSWCLDTNTCMTSKTAACNNVVDQPAFCDLKKQIIRIQK